MLPKRERIHITVKTYPTLSLSYGETVCTAGVREDGSWVRLYPVPFRRLDQEGRYKKYDWIECDIIRRTDDFRSESHSPTNFAQLRPVGHMGTENLWRERREFVTGKCDVFDDMDELIGLVVILNIFDEHQEFITPITGDCICCPDDFLDAPRDPS